MRFHRDFLDDLFVKGDPAGRAARFGQQLIVKAFPATQPAAVPGPTVESTKTPQTVTPGPQHVPAARKPARQAPTSPPPVVEAASGFITVNVSGTFGEVYIDNVDVGETPLINYRVKAGRHTIRVERVGYKTINETVQVDPNATVRKSWPLIPEG